MIYKVENGFLCSSKRGWIPGVYDDERTAKYAFKFKDKELQILQNKINPDGLITFTMLQKLYQENNKCHGNEEK